MRRGSVHKKTPGLRLNPCQIPCLTPGSTAATARQKNSLQKAASTTESQYRLLDLPPRSADQHSMDAAAAKAARKEAKRKKKEAKLLKRKLEGDAEPEAGGQSRAAKKKKAKKAKKRAADEAVPRRRRTGLRRVDGVEADERTRRVDSVEADAAFTPPAARRPHRPRTSPRRTKPTRRTRRPPRTARRPSRRRRSPTRTPRVCSARSPSTLYRWPRARRRASRRWASYDDENSGTRDPAFAGGPRFTRQREDGLGQDARVPRADGIVAASSFLFVAATARGDGRRRASRRGPPRGPPRRASTLDGGRRASPADGGAYGPSPSSPVRHRREVGERARAEAEARTGAQAAAAREQPADAGPQKGRETTQRHTPEKATTKKQKTQVDLLTKARFQQNRGLGGLVISPTRELSLQIYARRAARARRRLGVRIAPRRDARVSDRRREQKRRGGTTREGRLLARSDAR